MGWLRLLYIKMFEMPVKRGRAWAVFIVVCLWAFGFSWWMQEQGWP